jgi:hypothetical protein
MNGRKTREDNFYIYVTSFEIYYHRALHVSFCILISCCFIICLDRFTEICPNWYTLIILLYDQGSETVNRWTENTIVNVFIILLKITLNHIQVDSTITACRDIRWNILDYVIGFWSYRRMINVYQFGQISVKRSRHMIKQQEIKPIT